MAKAKALNTEGTEDTEGHGEILNDYGGGEGGCACG
jgi:hypothetical protein